MSKSNLEILNDYKSNVENTMSDTYDFVSFLPDKNTFQLLDNKQCYINDSNNNDPNKLQMKPVSQNLYTPRECMLHAGSKQM
jgi:hypothetical protein